MAVNSSEEKEIDLKGGAYEIIQDRLKKHGEDLRSRLQALNQARKQVFGSTETSLIATERITTENNCLARDIVALGDGLFLFGYNVHIGLKAETQVSDVLSVYHFSKDGYTFSSKKVDFLKDDQFVLDFSNLYKYYRETRFVKFARIGQHLFMVFQVGKSIKDVKTFKWAFREGGLVYVDNRSDHEFQFPDQHEFTWNKVTRDMQRNGSFPHFSIDDRIFIETTGGDLTIKVEDNTDTGKGIYAEPVDNPDQTLDDAEIYYSIIGNLVALKIKPYQEEQFRYIVFNEKIKQATRVDALEDSCVLLPDNQGIIFAKGYYIQSGEVKLFDNQLENMLFEKRIPSPNGEDFLYVFYQRETGIYNLLSYNIIEQEVKTPIVCNGYSLFEEGDLVFFKAEEEQQRHHVLQVWQTPFYSHNQVSDVESTSYLYKLGNKEIVRAMAECNEVVKLINKRDSYANLYIDLVKNATDVLDTYHWLNHQEASEINAPLIEIREAANTAIDEFEKVKKIKQSTEERSAAVFEKTKQLISLAKRVESASIHDFVERLSKLRAVRGELISLNELRYSSQKQIAEIEQELVEVTNQVSQQTVKFLLNSKALAPYEAQVEKLNVSVQEFKKAIEAKRIDEEITKVSHELEMLIEIVSNLKIEDATHTTRIIESISGLYSEFNSINAALKKKRKALLAQEGEAEFNAQLKLINQGLTNYLDIADSSAKCDEYLNKLLIQLEELESKFSEFEEFLAKIHEKREKVYDAFESKKVFLTEALNKRAIALQQSAERIIAGIQRRLNSFKKIEDINAYFTSDMMVDKVRSLSDELINLGDSVKGDDILSKLKSVYEEASRQLKDKNELFVDGENVIKFGKHAFNVNSQPVELSLVDRDGGLFLHITGTNFFEKIEDNVFDSFQSVKYQTLPSESDAVYRAEFLAFVLFKEIEEGTQNEVSFEKLKHLTKQELQEYVLSKMSLRYDEGYIKGVHDYDSALILDSILSLYHSIGLLRFSADARVLAFLFWEYLLDQEEQSNWMKQFSVAKKVLSIFPKSSSFDEVLIELTAAIEKVCSSITWLHPALLKEAAHYLFELKVSGQDLSFSREAWSLKDDFNGFIRKNDSSHSFSQSLEDFKGDFLEQYELIVNWFESYCAANEIRVPTSEIREAAVLFLAKDSHRYDSESKLTLKAEVEELKGDHKNLSQGKYILHFNSFVDRLQSFSQNEHQQYKLFAQAKKSLLKERRAEVRLNEFKPRVLSSFVRNKLISEVYLPIIGDNLAKQIGSAGASKRTDLMGMLLLISPPGYGKTTLMEYVASRLGLVFMKINGPAIGHSVTAIDPNAANNSASREELEKLNLAFEMGDNVMIYLDDIQHCNPEFLQKFISLCDAQRKVEGVYKGVSKTYDFRGKKVAVVMAGNPYTESGDKFQIPDMLANRADIYNLGDIIGDKSEAFELSYIENSLTSNSVLARLNGESREDVYSLVRIAATGDSSDVEFKGRYSAEEVSEYVNLLKKMIMVRNIILKVNQLYIDSASQADEFRTEPPFKLQGSYRNMNKIVEKLSPVMNEREVQTLVLSHYENESQTLTTGAEYNLLKFKELFGVITDSEKERKIQIIEMYLRNQRMKGMGGNQIGHVIEQMELITTGLQAIAGAIKR